MGSRPTICVCWFALQHHCGDLLWLNHAVGGLLLFGVCAWSKLAKDARTLFRCLLAELCAADVGPVLVNVSESGYSSQQCRGCPTSCMLVDHVGRIFFSYGRLLREAGWGLEFSVLPERAAYCVHCRQAGKWGTSSSSSSSSSSVLGVRLSGKCLMCVGARIVSP